MQARAINDAAFMMDEGICDNRPQDMDLAMVYGCGYPAARGGIFREADTWAIGKEYDYLLELEDEFGPRFTPSPSVKYRRRNKPGRGFSEQILPHHRSAMVWIHIAWKSETVSPG
jgi:hypothetical protein